jgi:hypothetical protein
VLKGQNAFEWLTSTEESINKGTGRLRFGILAELGRIEDDDALKAVATRVCELKPRNKDAVVMIRRWRTGKAPAGGALGLTDALIRCINDYIASHPGTTWQMVRAALENAADAVEESAGSGYLDQG